MLCILIIPALSVFTCLESVCGTTLYMIFASRWLTLLFCVLFLLVHSPFSSLLPALEYFRGWLWEGWSCTAQTEPIYLLSVIFIVATCCSVRFENQMPCSCALRGRITINCWLASSWHLNYYRHPTYSHTQFGGWFLSTELGRTALDQGARSLDYEKLCVGHSLLVLFRTRSLWVFLSCLHLSAFFLVFAVLCFFWVTSGCGQLPFTLCVVAIAVYVSVYASICGARAKYFQLQIWHLVCYLLSLIFLTSSVSFESYQCPCPPTLYFCAYYQCFLSLFAVMCLPCLYDAWSPLEIYTRFFSLANASVWARVFFRLARSRKIYLTVPSGSASWPISAIHWHAYSIWDTLFSVLACFHTSLVIRFTSGCGQLPHPAAANYPSLCVLSLSLAMSLCMPVYVEREPTRPFHHTARPLVRCPLHVTQPQSTHI